MLEILGYINYVIYDIKHSAEFLASSKDSKNVNYTIVHAKT